MERPSEKWQGLRRATAERAQRTAIEPLTPLYSAYFGVSVCYLVGFVCLQFYDFSGDFTLISAILLLIIAIAGTLVPVLTGSVLTLHFANRKLQRLATE